MGAPRVAVVTGASSGFGRRTAVALARAAFVSYGTLRDLSRRDELEAAAREAEVEVRLLPLDVDSDASVSAATAAILRATGRIDVLVSNAGFALGGSVEDLSLDELRQQFETNFFGGVRVAKAVLPHMRERRQGRLIFVSSISGFVGTPGLAAYCASKFALEGFAESLRYEALPFGIYVSLVQPGVYNTPIFGANRRTAAAYREGRSPYREMGERIERALVGGAQGSAADPDDVARAVVRIATTRRPRLRYTVGRDASLTAILRRLMPDAFFERHFVRMLGGR